MRVRGAHIHVLRRNRETCHLNANYILSRPQGAQACSFRRLASSPRLSAPSRDWSHRPSLREQACCRTSPCLQGCRRPRSLRAQAMRIPARGAATCGLGDEVVWAVVLECSDLAAGGGVGFCAMRLTHHSSDTRAMTKCRRNRIADDMFRKYSGTPCLLGPGRMKHSPDGERKNPRMTRVSNA